jgi:hypothetical protein
LTTVEGIPSKFDLKKILKVIKKQFACNGTIVNDEKAGGVIQLQGDQRNVVKDFLVDKEKGLEIDPKTIKVSNSLGFPTCPAVLMLAVTGPWLLIAKRHSPLSANLARGIGFGQRLPVNTTRNSPKSLEIAAADAIDPRVELVKMCRCTSL